MTATGLSRADPQIQDFVTEFLAAREGGLGTYEPGEDSFLLLQTLSALDLHALHVLDMGTGSGILAAYCARRGAYVVASDIDKDAIKDLQLTSNKMGISIKLVACDLFSKIHDRFDIVVFNPPYLPSSRIKDRTIDGGKSGTEVVSRFLGELTQHLVENGRGIIIVSSLNDPENLMASHPSLSFRTMREAPLFFERLYVLEVKAGKSSTAHSLQGEGHGLKISPVA
jgi:release factor glutamine methyltransferase